MEYISTRDTGESPESVSAARAINDGLASDGGLYVPIELPELGLDEIEKMKDMSYQERVLEILVRFFA